jgi:hypothetical protein
MLQTKDLKQQKKNRELRHQFFLNKSENKTASFDFSQKTEIKSERFDLSFL